MEELEPGLRRITFRLPLGIDHVHCYLLRSSGGGWILVDTGLGAADPEERWRPILDELDAPIERIVVTHMHPDHVGGARDVAELTGAPVSQGREDYVQALSAWGPDRAPGIFAEHWRKHGLPKAEVAAVLDDSGGLAPMVHYAPDPEPLDPGDEVDGWRVELLRGHSDNHIALVRDDVLIAGDTILAGITPAIGLYPNSRPDPLGDYFETLARIESLGLRVAYAGHGSSIDDPAARARQIRAHHIERLAHAEAALDGSPKSAHEVSLAIFSSQLSPTQRRFAVAESLAHLEYLVAAGRATEADHRYTAA